MTRSICLDHGLREDLYLDSDLHRCYRTPGHLITGIDDRDLAGYDFPERTVATPSGYTPPFVLNIQHPILAGECSFN